MNSSCLYEYSASTQSIQVAAGDTTVASRPTKEIYKAMAQLYVEHPEFRKQLDPFHPDLATFIVEGMRLFAEKKLH